MKILLTGAFGNVGTSIIGELQGRGHEVTCLDLPSAQAKQKAATLRNEFTAVWVDLGDQHLLASAMYGADVVLHIAAIIPPLSEKNPKLAQQVNVEGTRNLIAAAQSQRCPPRLIFASSVSVHGPSDGHEPPVGSATPLVATDSYNTTKIEAERLLRASGLRWSILRLGAVNPLSVQQFDPIMFEISLDSRVEFVHTRDVGLAFANAAERPAVDGKILMIGGGKRCQFTYREYFDKFLGAVGVGMLPETAFSTKAFYTDWMDCSEAEQLLQFQRYDFDDFLIEFAGLLGWRTALARLFRPLVRWHMLRQSPYYPQPKARLTAAHPPTIRTLEAHTPEVRTTEAHL